jgi:hypothetical protein
MRSARPALWRRISRLDPLLVDGKTTRCVLATLDLAATRSSLSIVGAMLRLLCTQGHGRRWRVPMYCWPCNRPLFWADVDEHKRRPGVHRVMAWRQAQHLATNLRSRERVRLIAAATVLELELSGELERL